jgi:hypothetical protein
VNARRKLFLIQFSNSQPVIVRLDRTIQYAVASRFILGRALEYWFARRSLSSGGALRRPGGGR